MNQGTSTGTVQVPVLCSLMLVALQSSVVGIMVGKGQDKNRRYGQAVRVMKYQVLVLYLVRTKTAKYLYLARETKYLPVKYSSLSFCCAAQHISR